jgi:hypothetical protein
MNTFPIKDCCVRFEVITAVSVKVFGNISACNFVDMHKFFGGITASIFRF